MNRLYVLSREDHDDCCNLMCFVDKETAMNELIKFAVTTKKIGAIYMYDFPKDNTTSLKNVGIINMKTTDDFKSHTLWSEKVELGLSDEEVLRNPSLLYHTLT